LKRISYQAVYARYSYDHLDWPTIEKIHKLKGNRVKYIAPLKLDSWFRSGGIPEDQIVEMDWHDSVELRASERHPAVKFICAPAQHGSGQHMPSLASCGFN
jgi:N-acyl-phosphatidylethanolamine-hydrolysing phospholipase D